MFYLHRYTADDVQIAVCEDAGHVERYEARGFTRCTLAEFRVAWRERDAKRRAELTIEDARVMERVAQTETAKPTNSTNSWRGGT